MADVQTQFNKFHDSIKLSDVDENETLRTKRDALIDDLRAHLPGDVPSFTWFNQGSYAVGTGNDPPDGNYDIDVGLFFACTRSKYPNPVDLKKKVRDALSRYNRTVVIRRPCVTVNYMRDGEIDYHVDLAIYVKRTEDACLDLALGKENSDKDNRSWQLSDPKGYIAAICAKHADDARAQFNRCVRYLKWWRDVKIGCGASLRSVGLTSAAYYWFAPFADAISGRHIDLVALRKLVRTMLSIFTLISRGGQNFHRLKVQMPAQPYDDLLAKMTDADQESFYNKLNSLADALEQAEKEPLPEVACKLLQQQFGDKFEVPEKAETAQRVAAPYVTSGTSA